MPHVLRRAAVVVAATTALVPTAAAQARTATHHREHRAVKAASCANADLLPSATNLPAIRRATLCLLNVERGKHGRRALRFNRELAKAANNYAQTMVNQEFFSHVSPTGSTFVSRIKQTDYLGGVVSWAVGENLAYGGGTESSPRETVVAWMHSPGHRRNILAKRYTEIGIGVAYGTPDGGVHQGATYATEFGRRTLAARR
jgi:uncharacterized protein YkwD